MDQETSQQLRQLQQQLSRLEQQVKQLTTAVPGMIETAISTITITGQTGIMVSGAGRAISVGLIGGGASSPGGSASTGTSIWTGATVQLELCDGTLVTVPDLGQIAP